MQWGEEASSAVKNQLAKVRAEKQLTRRNAHVSCFSVFDYWLKLTRERMLSNPAI